MRNFVLAGISVSFCISECVRPTLLEAVVDMLTRASRLSTVPSVDQVDSSPNVVRINRVLPQETWNSLFPLANLGLGPSTDPYNYANFLKAAAMWPNFCNDQVASSAMSLDDMCLRELASIFSQYAQEVGDHDASLTIPEWKQGLYYFTQIGCIDGNTSTTNCQYRGASCDDPTDWAAVAWPCPDGIMYFGRGSLQMSYNYNYGPFSYAMFGDSTILLDNPQLVIEGEPWLAFASGLWFYMTPQSPKPSMHDVVTGFWIPNAADIAAGRVPGYGALIMIINGNAECGQWTQEASDRATFYSAFLQEFNLPVEENLSCATMALFDNASSGFVNAYWDQTWDEASCGNSCQLVPYQTPNSIFDDPGNPDVPYNACMMRIFGDLSETTSTKDPEKPSSASPGISTPLGRTVGETTTAKSSAKYMFNYFLMSLSILYILHQIL